MIDLQRKRILIFDLETLGLRPELGETAFAGATYAVGDRSAKVYWFDDPTDREEFVKCLKTADIFANHNVKFDIRQAIRTLGIPAEFFLGKPWLDTQGWSVQFAPWRTQHGLKHLTKQLDARLGHEDPKAWIKKNRKALKAQGIKKPTFGDIPREIITPYVANDVVRVAYLLAKHGPAYKGARGGRAEELTLHEQLLKTTLKMELKGLRILPDRLAEAEKFYTKKADRLEKAIPFRCVGTGSRLALEEFYAKEIEALGLYKPGTLPCDGQVCLDAEAMHRLVRHRAPYAEEILQFREARTVLTRYIAEFRQWEPQGRIHPTFKLFTTRTGRLASESPNAQNIPSELKKILGPDDEDHTLICVDFERMELYGAAYMSGDEVMTADLAGDLHSENARRIFGKLTPTFRKAAKTVIFALFYGAGPLKIAWTLNSKAPREDGRPWTVADARRIIAAFWDRYRTLKLWVDNVGKQARKGLPITDPLGHTHYPNRLRYYALVNYVIQGFTAQICKRAMAKADDKGLDLRIQIHDDITIHAPIKEAEEAAHELKECMEDVAGFHFPAEIAYAPSNWGTKLIPEEFRDWRKQR